MLQRNVVTAEPARFGMRAGAGVPDGGESDELAAAYREVFLGEGVYPAILGAYCEPTLDEMACVCSYHPQGEFL
jgi:hypothetical protein